VVNPLGVAKGKHKQMGFQVAIGNLDPSDRQRMENILLPVLLKTKVYKVHGMARAISGVDLGCE
jgi:hypothetical protein